MVRKPLARDDAEKRYIDALNVRDWLRLSYERAAALPQLRKRIKATLKSADGAVNNARRFYAEAVRRG